MRWLALSVLCTATLVAFAPSVAVPGNPTQLDGLRAAAAMLRGDGARADFAADFVGARALTSDTDAYAPLAQPFAEIGLDWPTLTRNTHPPTAFLIALPVSWLAWPTASMIWGWLTLLMFAGTTWAMGARWPIALAAAPLWLLWPPAAWSLGQTTAVWLLCAALAYRWRDRPWLAGALIGVAALPKLLPAVLLMPFILRRQWQPVASFAAVWAIALAALAAMNPAVISDYLTTGREASSEVMQQPANAAIIPNLVGGQRTLVLLAVGLVLVAAIVRWRRASWRAWEWASVALLPIAWVYSLLPLAPLLWRALRAHGLTAAGAGAAVGIPVVIFPFGADSPMAISGAIAAAGIAALRLTPQRFTRQTSTVSPPTTTDGPGAIGLHHARVPGGRSD